MKVRGRRVTIGSVVVGAVVIVWAGFTFEEKVLEQWYLWKLESAEEEEVELAAERLGEMRSRRAIPQLVEILRRAPEHRGAVRSVAFSPDGRRIVSTAVIWDAASGKLLIGDIRSHYSFKALVRIGSPAVPALLRLLEDKGEANRSRAAAALNEIDPQEDDGIPALGETLEDSFRR